MKVHYVGQFDVASDSPGLQRVIGIARSLTEAGHEVTVAGTGRSGGDLELAPGVIGASGPSPIRLLDRNGLPDLVISYGGDIFHTRALRSWSARREVPRALDSVEWYDRAHIAGGPLGSRALLNEYCMRRAYPRYPHVIPISSYLRNHYESKGCSSLRVPPTLDVQAIDTARPELGSRLALAYAGTPGKKDLLGEVIAGVVAADPAGDLVTLDVFGIDEATLRTALDIDVSRHRGITAHGRVSRKAAVERVALADFVPLLRADARFAHAGFPTKVAEAMAFGTPVIANLTSDLQDVIIDGTTGLVASEPTASGFAGALSRALAMSDADRSEMRRRARQRADEYFDFRRYTRALDEFVHRAAGRQR